MFTRIVLLVVVFSLPVSCPGAEQATANYANYKVSIKKGTRGKRSGDISKFYYALPDHDMLALKINLEPANSQGNVQAWPVATRNEQSKIWVVGAEPGDFALADAEGRTYHSLRDNPTEETGARQYADPVKFYLKDNGKQALIWPNWLWFDIPKNVATGNVFLQFGDARLSLEMVEDQVRKCSPNLLKVGRCDYELPADQPNAMVTFLALKKNPLFKDHIANYSVYPSTCHTDQRDHIRYTLGQARNEPLRKTRYQARITAGEPVILSASLIDPGFRPTMEDDRHCSILLELTLEADQAYEIRSEIMNNDCGVSVFRKIEAGRWEDVATEQIPGKRGKADCKKYLKTQRTD